MKFNEIDFSKNVQIMVESEKDEKKLCKLLHDKGFKWGAGKSLLDLQQWTKHTKKLYYILHKADEHRSYAYVSFSDEEYMWFENVINFNEIKESEEKEMRKEQLKAGMNVVLRDGTKCLVVETKYGMVLYDEDADESFDVNYYTADMKHSFAGNLDVMKVYSLPKYASEYDAFDGYARDVIYDRSKSEIKEVTMQEIADKLGIAVETLRIKE